VLLLLVFSICLLVAVLFSGLAQRTMLSTAVIFLLAGFIFGRGALGVAAVESHEHPVVEKLSEFALFSVLFTDGMRIGIRDLASAWRLPGRALLLGLPLTLLGTALCARLVVGLPWPDALLLGAALSPTDPVFAAAIVGREEVPGKLRHLLNVESGLNDGLALPVVVTMLAISSREETDIGHLLLDVAMGVAIGVVVPWVAIRLEKSRFFGAAPLYQPLNGVAIALLVLTISSLTQANEFLAAFAAGITVVTIDPSIRAFFHPFGEPLTELLKLAALLVFGSLISLTFLREIPASGYLFGALALVVVRPIALWIALWRSGMSFPEKAAAAWFGPKGFASVVYGLLILQAPYERGDQLFHLIAIVVAASILAHSSTDVLVARWLEKEEEEAPGSMTDDEG